MALSMMPSKKNWAVVRRLVGYDRLEWPALAALERIHDLADDYINFLHPVRKLVSKTRSGPRVTRRYDVAKTPFHRLLDSGALSIRLDERAYRARALRDGDDWHVFLGGDYRRLALRHGLTVQEDEARAGSLAAPMPGKVVQVMSRPGEAVKKGQALLILEAMKMEHTITAPADGQVKEIHYAAGEQVLEGAELIRLE